MREYKAPKKVYHKDDISFALLLFDNGDYIPISGAEIDDISVRLYDKLILAGDKLCAAAESGVMKLNLQKKPKMIYADAFVYDPKQFKTDRKSYIENRLNTEGGLIGIRFFDENNFHTTVFGNIISKTENHTICLEYIPKPFFEPYASYDHVVYLNRIKKSLIRSIELDFENCEGFAVYSHEIVEIHLNLKKELELSGCDYCRVIKDGYIVLKLDDDMDYRQMFFLDNYNGKVSRKTLERRLCGKKGSAVHDICHLYINYLYSGFGTRSCECLEVEDIKPDEEIEELEKKEEETGRDHYYFEGGKCRRQEDGTIRITFGKKENKEKSK